MWGVFVFVVGRGIVVVVSWGPTLVDLVDWLGLGGTIVYSDRLRDMSEGYGAGSAHRDEALVGWSGLGAAMVNSDLLRSRSEGTGAGSAHRDEVSECVSLAFGVHIISVMIIAPCRGSEITTIVFGLPVMVGLSMKKLGTVACAAHSVVGDAFNLGVIGLLVLSSLSSKSVWMASAAFCRRGAFVGFSEGVVTGVVVGVIVVVDVVGVVVGVVPFGGVVVLVVVGVDFVCGFITRLRHLPYRSHIGWRGVGRSWFRAGVRVILASLGLGVCLSRWSGICGRRGGSLGGCGRCRWRFLLGSAPFAVSLPYGLVFSWLF